MKRYHCPVCGEKPDKEKELLLATTPGEQNAAQKSWHISCYRKCKTIKGFDKFKSHKSLHYKICSDCQCKYLSNSVNGSCPNCGFNPHKIKHKCDSCGFEYKDSKPGNSKCPNCGNINNRSKFKEKCESCGYEYEDHCITNSRCPKCNNLNKVPKIKHTCIECNNKWEDNIPGNSVCPKCGFLNDRPDNNHICEECGIKYTDKQPSNSKCPKCGNINGQIIINHVCEQCLFEYNDCIPVNSQCPNCNFINNRPVYKIKCQNCKEIFEGNNQHNIKCPYCGKLNGIPKIKHTCDKCGLSYTDAMPASSKCPSCGNMNDLTSNFISKSYYLKMLKKLNNKWYFQINKFINLNPDATINDILNYANKFGIPSTKRDLFYYQPLSLVTLNNEHPLIDNIESYRNVITVWSIETQNGETMDVCKTVDGAKEMLQVLRIISGLKNKTCSPRKSARHEKIWNIMQYAKDKINFRIIGTYSSETEALLAEIQWAHDTKAKYWHPSFGQIKMISEMYSYTKG